MGKRGISQEKYAQRRGVTSAAVRKALASGRIIANPDGSIDPVRADADWTRNTDASKVRGSRANGAAYLKARAKRERYLAELARLEYEAAAKRLVSAEEVEKAAFETGRRIR